MSNLTTENGVSKEIAVQAPVSDAATVMTIIANAAADPNMDVAKLEKLMDLQERILNRNAAQAFSADFAKMQMDLPEVMENGQIKVNGDIRSKYGLFEDINNAAKPILQKYGFAISFRIKQDGGFIKVTGVLRHRDGHFEETEISLPTDSSGSKNPVQAIGSSVSYGKRYTMCALLNITTRGQDDDGAALTAVLELEKAVEIDLLITSTKSDKAKFLSYMGVDDVRKILARDYQKAINLLKAKERKNAAA